MKIRSARLQFLEIPLQITVTHGARAGRAASDSIILALEDVSGRVGYGEAVVRDYVSGSLADAQGLPARAAALVRRLVEPFFGVDSSWQDARTALLAAPCSPQELPFLCATETALLDLACAETKQDAYQVLGQEPLHATVRYGGVIPIVPTAQVEQWIDRYMTFGFSEVKVKLGDDPGYNATMLAACRRRLGQGFAMRVDANGSWTPASIVGHLALCERHGVRVVEQPLPAGGAPGLLEDARRAGFTLIADEGVLTEADLPSAGYAAVNLRLSKNGGLTRLLLMASAAEERGLRYQLGCMVGETALLSALGRIAATLLPRALFREGSYDDIILTANVAERGVGFTRGGEAHPLRGHGLGCLVSAQKLSALTVQTVAC